MRYSLNDVQLTKDLKMGSEQALSRLHWIWRPYLTMYARSILRDKTMSNDAVMAEAEDIVQEVFITIWEKRERLEENLAIQSYLFVAARNKCLNYLRKRRLHKRYINQQQADMQSTVPCGYELEESVQEAINSLTPKEREVINLFYNQNYSQKEIKAQTGQSVQTIKNNLVRARLSLRTKLKVVPR